MKQVCIDGNSAATHIAYAFDEVACIYPITPSSTMAEMADEWQAVNRKNLFGTTLNVVELQSEAGAAGAVHGSLVGGALTTTFTASQGLLLMIPNMYKIAGELLPTVFHVSARALSTHALSIFGDQADVMACRNTGFAMLCSGSVQEINDLATVAHIATLKSSVPFMHFFDGFRTSHEINKISQFDYEELNKVLPKKEIAEFKKRALSSQNPYQQGTSQNPDIYFQNREAANPYYTNTVNVVESAMEDIYKLSGRKYKLFDYYGDKDAEVVIIMMGSAYLTAKETIEYLNKTKGLKAGVIAVRLYRPFSEKHLLKALPKTVKKIAVLDRTKEPGSEGEPLYKDICTALYNAKKTDITVVGGRYGLGGKDFTNAMAKAVLDNLKLAKPKNGFTVGIQDDVTNTSLPVKDFEVPNKQITCKFFGLGSDGTVSANKNTIKIIGDNTSLNAQGFFEYDSKKSGSLTTSHLRFGKDKSFGPYLVYKADFVACHNFSFIGKYDMLIDVKEGGTFLLNSPYEVEKLPKLLPQKFVNDLVAKNINFYVVDANSVSEKTGLGKIINVVMQACFFKLAKLIDYKKAETLLITAAKKTYERKGEQIVKANVDAIKNATKELKKVDLSIFKVKEIKSQKLGTSYEDTFIKPIETRKGDSLPVSCFDARGIVPTDTAKFEKRGISVESPKWIPERCIQCGMCCMACPHAALRPVLVKEGTPLPEGYITKPAIGMKGYEYRIQINVKDCTGCSNCANVCPVKALEMTSAVELAKTEDKNYEFSKDIENPPTIFAKHTLKGSQFLKPYFEFSGACAGCGETPYVKLVSQLFGKRMLVANATGCSSIYSGSAPTCPYAKNAKGKGPAWASSLFEDNAEFGLGIELAKQKNRLILKTEVEKSLPQIKDANLTGLLNEWLNNFDDGDKTYELSEKISEILATNKQKYQSLIDLQNLFVKESLWIIGGDGWAYDIGFGGLDHIIASGTNVNILVLDTEVYSNTGGQSSKATPAAAIAKFATNGKSTRKKDLGMMAMTYKDVYVAQVGMGANMNQVAKAFVEAEKYNGPSLIIAYAPCINHGISMTNTQNREKLAVESGYWHLYRYNPELRKTGENPFVLDSPAPSKDYMEFLKTENRYKALLKTNPEQATALFEKSKQDAKERYETYKNLAGRE